MNRLQLLLGRTAHNSSVRCTFSHTNQLSTAVSNHTPSFGRLVSGRHYTTGGFSGYDDNHHNHDWHNHDRHTHRSPQRSMQPNTEHHGCSYHSSSQLQKESESAAPVVETTTVTADDTTNEDELYVWRRIAAEVGEASANFEIGSQYFSGKASFAKDEVKAVEWFSKAANAGHAKGQNVLGCCHANSRGVEQNQDLAIFWWTKAADQGEVEALLSLGVLYANGMGVIKDERKAFDLFERAADKGNPTALEWVSVCYRAGFVVKQDEQKAQELLMEAADARLCGEFEEMVSR